MSGKIRGYKVRAYEGSPWLWVEDSLEALTLALDESVGVEDASVGTKVTIEVCEISEEESRSMPEFEGF